MHLFKLHILESGSGVHYTEMGVLVNANLVCIRVYYRFCIHVYGDLQL